MMPDLTPSERDELIALQAETQGPTHSHPPRSPMSRTLNVARRHGTPYQPRHCNCVGCWLGFSHVPTEAS